MRIVLIVGAACLGLAACSSPAGTLGTVLTGSQAVQAAVPDITNDINLALASANKIVAQVATVPNTTVAAAATKLHAAIVKWQGNITNASPKVAAALSEINTLAAIVLNVAALAGYPIP